MLLLCRRARSFRHWKIMLNLLLLLCCIICRMFCCCRCVSGKVCMESKAKRQKKEQRPEKCSKITLGNIVALSALVIQMMDESYEPETGSVVSVECEQAAQSSAAVGRKERRAHIFKELFYSLCDIYAWSWHSFFATIIITLNCFQLQIVINEPICGASRQLFIIFRNISHSTPTPRAHQTVSG